MIFEEIGEMLKFIKTKKNVIREKTNIKNSFSVNIKYKQLNCYGHLRRMNEESLPQKKIKGRPRNLWMQEVTTGIREKGINNMEWIDRGEGK